MFFLLIERQFTSNLISLIVQKRTVLVLILIIMKMVSNIKVMTLDGSLSLN